MTAAPGGGRSAAPACRSRRIPASYLRSRALPCQTAACLPACACRQPEMRPAFQFCNLFCRLSKYLCAIVLKQAQNELLWQLFDQVFQHFLIFRALWCQKWEDRRWSIFNAAQKNRKRDPHYGGLAKQVGICYDFCDDLFVFERAKGGNRRCRFQEEFQ